MAQNIDNATPRDRLRRIVGVRISAFVHLTRASDPMKFAKAPQIPAKRAGQTGSVPGADRRKWNKPQDHPMTNWLPLVSSRAGQAIEGTRSARAGQSQQSRSRQFPAAGYIPRGGRSQAGTPAEYRRRRHYHLRTDLVSHASAAGSIRSQHTYDLIASKPVSLMQAQRQGDRNIRIRPCSSRPMTWGGPPYSPSSARMAAAKGPGLPRRRMRKSGLWFVVPTKDP